MQTGEALTNAGPPPDNSVQRNAEVGIFLVAQTDRPLRHGIDSRSLIWTLIQLMGTPANR